MKGHGKVSILNARIGLRIICEHFSGPPDLRRSNICYKMVKVPKLIFILLFINKSGT